MTRIRWGRTIGAGVLGGLALSVLEVDVTWRMFVAWVLLVIAGTILWGPPRD